MSFPSQFLRMNDYVSLALVTAVIYDYVLTFPREIDYVWLKPWSWVSTCFVMVRYFGLSWVIVAGTVGTTLVSVPEHASTTAYIFGAWEFLIFLAAADLMMLLRVYAMWKKSKWILCVLLSIYVTQLIASLILTGIYNNTNTYLAVTAVLVLDFSFCGGSFNNAPSLIGLYQAIPRFVLSVVLLALAVIQASTETIQVYGATKQWQPSQYMKHLTGHGILYFIVNVLYNITLVCAQTNAGMNATMLLFLILISYMTLCPIMPRFIISIRELYDCGRDADRQGIDTGFGFRSRPTSGSMVLSTIALEGGISESGQDGDTGEVELDGTRRV